MAANVTSTAPSLANYWWYEHLLCLPDVDTEIVTHFGERLKELPTGNMPASLAVRLFLRQIMLHAMEEEDLLSVMNMFQLHSEKRQQFQSTAVAQAIQPPDTLFIKVRPPINTECTLLMMACSAQAFLIDASREVSLHAS